MSSRSSIALVNGDGGMSLDAVGYREYRELEQGNRIRERRKKEDAEEGSGGCEEMWMMMKKNMKPEEGGGVE